MAPKVIVPMDFGRHLRDSPTHNTLKLKTSSGGEVLASSVILSFNSPVIDHMTTTLHMTSVDMLEFSEAAVQVFVDAAYSGSAEGINKTLFRDINKMAHAFEMTWLSEKCKEYFYEVAKSIKKPLIYSELTFLFEEAAFALDNLKSDDFYKVCTQKFESLNCKRSFLEMYLKKVEADKLTHKKLDMLIELAGEEVNIVIKFVVNQLSLSQSQNPQGPSLSFASLYLLENSDLSLCKRSDKALFGQLFDLLLELPNKQMKWALKLYRKAAEEEQPCTPRDDPIASGSGANQASSETTESAAQAGFETTESDETVSNGSSKNKPTNTDRSQIIPNLNLNHSLNLNMSFGDLMKWITTSKDVTSLLLAIEAVIIWVNDDNRMLFDTRNKINTEVMEATLLKLINERNWPLLPEYFQNYANAIPRQNAIRRDEMFLKFNWRPFCVTKTRKKPCKYVIIKRQTNASDQMASLTDGKILFHFKHPQVPKCKQPGNCGFILKEVPDETALFKLRLCNDKADYKNQSVHFHDEIRAEKMHIYQSNDGLEDNILIPYSWLSETQLNQMHLFKQFHINCNSFRVLYNLDLSRGT